MRGFRLNGWQRIGIVLSVLWTLGIGAIVIPEDARRVGFLQKCLGGAESAVDYCNREYGTSWWVDSIIMFFPLLSAWLLSYIAVWTVRWIRRVFQPSSS